MERIVSTVIEQLTAAGIHTIRGYDGSQLPILDSPMAAVSIADAVYRPISADSVITENAYYIASGLRAEAKLLIEVYDDFRHGDQACVEAATLAASICGSLSGEFTCGKIQIGCVHYEPDYDCFCCSVSVPVGVFIARSEQVS